MSQSRSRPLSSSFLFVATLMRLDARTGSLLAFGAGLP
jgi:hypothetical protein